MQNVYFFLNGEMTKIAMLSIDAVGILNASSWLENSGINRHNTSACVSKTKTSNLSSAAKLAGQT